MNCQTMKRHAGNLVANYPVKEATLLWFQFYHIWKKKKAIETGNKSEVLGRSTYM